MDFRIIGSILLIIGTSIGAGILALPVVTAAGGFYFAAFLLLACWLIMTTGAFLLLEVSLNMPMESNIITMAKHTLGIPGQIFAWFVYLLLLYSLISAYLSGGTDVVGGLFHLTHLNSPAWLNTLFFLGILGFIVYKGMRSVDWVNRGLMLIKLAILSFLIFFTLPYIQTKNLTWNSPLNLLPAVMVVITSFGFAIIIPSLRVYLKGDIKKLKIALLTGSLIALVCYFLWLLVIQGSIPNSSLTSITQTNNTISQLSNLLIKQLHNPVISSLIHIFTSICMLTSFLGVSLSLSDFLSDGLQIKKAGKGNLLIYTMTFLPSLLLVLFLPSIFINALAYAGIFCVLLLILLPALMVRKLRQKQKTFVYQVGGKHYLPVLAIAVSIILLIIAITVHT